MASYVRATTTRLFSTLLLAVSLEPSEIGRRIAAARLERGWTQAVLSQQANVSLGTIQRWEAGKLPPIRELIRLAGVLEISPEQLVEPNDPPESVTERLDRVEAELAWSRGLLARIAAAVGAEEAEEPVSRTAAPRPT